MSSLQIRKLTYAALFLAIAMVLPFVTLQIPTFGSMLCPMHIPALLCGFLCGWPWGLAVGFIAPLLRSVIFGMPPMFPVAVVMTFELATYGAIAGLLYRLLPGKKGIIRIYIALVVSMIVGRIIYGILYLCLSGLGFISTEVTWLFFWINAFADPFPGILLQLVLIPALVIVMERAGLSLNRRPGHSV